MMKTISSWSLALALAAMLLPASAAFAQGRNDGPMAGGFQEGRQGGPPPGQIVSAVTTPISTLTTALSLTNEEQSQIEQIQSDFRQKMGVLAPRPADNEMGQQSHPVPPDAETRYNIADLAESESAQIDAQLTPAQQSSLTTLVSQLKELQSAQISPRLYSRLNLTAVQYSQISKIEMASHDALKPAVVKAASDGDYDGLEATLLDSHRLVHAQVVALLTPDQSAMLQDSNDGRGNSYRSAQGFNRLGGGMGQGMGNGGPGGFGGPGGPNGFGGPGAGPDGQESNNGQFGPPPPDGNGPPPPDGNGPPQGNGGF